MTYQAMVQAADVIGNSTWPRVIGSSNCSEAPPYRHLGPTGQTIVTTAYVIGVIGSLAALYILYKDKNARYKNKKHSLMLKCLAGSDLVGLLGMLVQMYIQLYAPTEVSQSHLSCVFRVLWRWFGLGSGCVAIVMAVERWLALTHPFFYQKNVTYPTILKAIIFLWTAAAALVCMPFIGFGLYYDANTNQCKRYRLARTPIDIVYAYVFFTFGVLLCIVISCANLSVTKSLCYPSRLHYGRRITTSLKRQKSTAKIEYNNCSTPEEVAFARLMVALSASFVLCWLPQMLSIPLAQYSPDKFMKFFKAADTLMAIHFTLDPYIYVLLHHQFPCLNITFELVPRHCCCCFRSDKSDDGVSDTFIT